MLNVVNNANCGSQFPRIPTVFYIQPPNASTKPKFFSTLLEIACGEAGCLLGTNLTMATGQIATPR